MIIQGRIQGGQRYTGTWDLGASCSSFVSALDAVARIVATDPSVERACVVGVYNMPAYFRTGDVFGYSIFADGAAAVVVEKTGESDSRYLGGQLLADGTQWNYVGVYSGGTRQPVTAERLETGEYGLHPHGVPHRGKRGAYTARRPRRHGGVRRRPCGVQRSVRLLSLEHAFHRFRECANTAPKR